MSRNDITMDSIRTRGPNEKFDEGWARIFGKRVYKDTVVAPGCELDQALEAKDLAKAETIYQDAHKFYHDQPLP